MKDPKQNTRFTDTEMSLLKGLFSDNLELLYIIRKVMLQFDLTPTENKTLRDAWNPQVKSILQEVFLPEIDPDVPLFQLTSMVIGLGSDIKGLSPEGALPMIKAKDIEIKYVAQQLEVLDGSTQKPKILLSDLSKTDGDDEDESFINLTAWNFLLSFIDTHIQEMKFLAGQKKETVEETKARLGRDSSK